MSRLFASKDQKPGVVVEVSFFEPESPSSSNYINGGCFVKLCARKENVQAISVIQRLLNEEISVAKIYSRDLVNHGIQNVLLRRFVSDYKEGNASGAFIVSFRIPLFRPSPGADRQVTVETAQECLMRIAETAKDEAMSNIASEIIGKMIKTPPATPAP